MTNRRRFLTSMPAFCVLAKIGQVEASDNESQCSLPSWSATHNEGDPPANFNGASSTIEESIYEIPDFLKRLPD